MTFEIVTPSYGPDFERCELLCASIDRFVTGHLRHVIVVDRCDRERFSPLEGPQRSVVVAEDILPRGLWRWPLKLGPMKRAVWLSTRARPVHGWHLQQIKKILIALTASADHLLFIDSDVVFVRPADLADLVVDGRLTHLRTTGGITADMPNHITWSANASRLIGQPALDLPAPDNIGHLVPWRHDTALAMKAAIEAASGVDWITALLRTRQFSEYLLYGRFVEQVEGFDRHLPVEAGLCRSYWDPVPLDRAALRELFTSIDDHEVAVSITSTSGTSFADVRAVLEDLEPPGD